VRIGLRVLSNPAWTGGVNYVLNIARMLAALPQGERPDEVVFLPWNPAGHAIAEQHADLADRIVPFTEAGSLGLDFVYPATQLAEAPFGAPWAGWIPDWQHIHLPEMFGERELARRLIQYRILAQRPAVTVLSSRMALEDTRAVCGEETAELRILHFPAIFEPEVYARSPGRIADARARHGAPERYLVICNQFWLHKNHLVAFEALRHTRQDVRLVMTGEIDDERWPDYAARIRALMDDPQVGRRVTITGRIDRDDQIDLMLGAMGFLQPSRFEGWSTFVEEARALGKPMLLSDFPVHREQSPPGGAFFDPGDPEALAARLDAWFAKPPAPTPPAEAEARHQAYVLDCARSFMDIARLARSGFRPERHDPKPIAAAAAGEVEADVAAGRLSAEDEVVFQAAVRQLFRDYPEELAGLALLLDNPACPMGARGRKLLIDPVLAKLDPDQKKRFDRAVSEIRLRPWRRGWP
jgi:glycosyltransferase involved in cell wall biosynthesis